MRIVLAIAAYIGSTELNENGTHEREYSAGFWPYLISPLLKV